MSKDYIEFAKGFQECEKHVGIQHVPASELHSIIKPLPFRGWELYLIGEIRPASPKIHIYIWVGIGYFTKWVRVVPFINIDQEAVINFIQSHFIYKFRIPKTLTTNQGTIFIFRKMVEFASDSRIKQLTSTPYYAQENVQVESSNKIIIGLIKRHVGQKPRN